MSEITRIRKKLAAIKKMHFGKPLTSKEKAVMKTKAPGKKRDRNPQRLTHDNKVIPITEKSEQMRGKKLFGIDVRRSMDCTGMVVNYSLYLRSQHWLDTRERKFREVGKQCQKCRSKSYIQVHHLNYCRLGREELIDLEVVCRKCHKEIHKR